MIIPGVLHFHALQEKPDETARATAGRWSESDIKISLTEGLRPYGMPLAPQMPFPFYKIMTASDLDAVVAYLRSVPAVKNAVQPPVYRATAKVEIVPGADKPLNESELRNPVQRGFSAFGSKADMAQ
jgi:hypothetical protein